MPPPPGGPGTGGGGADAAPEDDGKAPYYVPLLIPPAPTTASGGAVPASSDQDDATGDQSGSSTTSSPIYQITPTLKFGSMNPNNSRGFGMSLALMKQKQMTYNWQSCSANNAGNRGGSSYTYNSQTSRKSNYGICIGVQYSWDDAARDIDVTLYGEVTLMQDEFADLGFDVPAFEVGVAIGF